MPDLNWLLACKDTLTVLVDLMAALLCVLPRREKNDRSRVVVRGVLVLDKDSPRAEVRIQLRAIDCAADRLDASVLLALVDGVPDVIGKIVPPDAEVVAVRVLACDHGLSERQFHVLTRQPLREHRVDCDLEVSAPLIRAHLCTNFRNRLLLE